MSNVLKKLFSRLKDVSLYGLSQSVMPIGQLGISYYIIKFKSIELWGNYVELFIWVNLLLLLISFGSRDILLKNFSSDPSSTYQQWLTNIISRSLFIVPCISIIFLFPIFENLQFLVAVWLLLLFINHSFQVLMLYYKDFKFSLTSELIFYIFVFLLLVLNINFIDIESFVLIFVLGNFVKSLLYIFFYFRKMTGLKIKFSWRHLRNSVPFFIPITLGTVRVKIDTYFANTFFSSTDIGKYQILINFLMVGQLITTYFVNPYLKVFYRLNHNIIKRLKVQSLYFGLFFGLLFTYLTYIILTNVYQIAFSTSNYIVAFTYIVPLLFQMIIINQIYRNNKQSIVSIVALFTVLLQLIIGYIIIKNYGIDGAIIIKSGSQWLITILLWIWLNKLNNRQTVYL